MSGPSASAAGMFSQPTPTLSTVASKAPQGSSRLFDIPSLNDDGTNFQMCKFHIQTILGVHCIWGVVSGDNTKPDQATHPTEYEKWLAKDKEAHAQITLTLKDEPLSGVLYSTMSAEVWRKLSEHYEGHGKQSIAYLISELFRNTLSNDTSMETQLKSSAKHIVLDSSGQSHIDPQSPQLSPFWTGLSRHTFSVGSCPALPRYTQL